MSETAYLRDLGRKARLEHESVELATRIRLGIETVLFKADAHAPLDELDAQGLAAAAVLVASLHLEWSERRQSIRAIERSLGQGPVNRGED